MNIKILLLASIAAILSGYNFTLFDFLTPLFTSYYFPSDNKYLSLLSAYMVYFVGYLSLPLGGLLWGHIGDRAGRKVAFSSSLCLMGISTFFIGVCPSYLIIGTLGTLVLIVCRISQGLAFGGEAGAALFNLEHTSVNKKGFASGCFNAIVTTGIFLGSFTAYLCTLPSMPSWIWRVPFILGFFTFLLGILIQKFTTETPEFQTIKKEEIVKFPFAKILKLYNKQFFFVIFLTGFSAVLFHLNFIFLPVFLKSNFLFTDSFVRLTSTISIWILIILMPIFGYLSDRIGFASSMKGGILLSLAICLWMFPRIDNLTSYELILGQTSLAISLALFNCPWCAYVAQAFDKKFRLSGLSAAQTIASAVFGGSTPLIALYLSYQNQGLFLLTGYILLWAFLSLISINCLESLNNLVTDNIRGGDRHAISR